MLEPVSCARSRAQQVMNSTSETFDKQASPNFSDDQVSDDSRGLPTRHTRIVSCSHSACEIASGYWCLYAPGPKIQVTHASREGAVACLKQSLVDLFERCAEDGLGVPVTARPTGNNNYSEVVRVEVAAAGVRPSCQAWPDLLYFWVFECVDARSRFKLVVLYRHCRLF